MIAFYFSDPLFRFRVFLVVTAAVFVGVNLWGNGWALFSFVVAYALLGFYRITRLK